jgi:hypothetical protein
MGSATIEKFCMANNKLEYVDHVGNRMTFLHKDFLRVSDPYWHASVARRESSRKSRHENIKGLLH